MSNSHSMIPIEDNDRLPKMTEYVWNERRLYIPPHVPRGRYPFVGELRHVLTESGYAVEENLDWYVSAEEDGTIIWFNGENRSDDDTARVVFRRGGMVPLDIPQKLANQCGSFLVNDGSGLRCLLIVPDYVYELSPQPVATITFMGTMQQRIPIMIEKLRSCSTEETRFFLSQLLTAVTSMYDPYKMELRRSMADGVEVYAALTAHEDAKIRAIATDLLARIGDSNNLNTNP